MIVLSGGVQNGKNEWDGFLKWNMKLPFPIEDRENARCTVHKNIWYGTVWYGTVRVRYGTGTVMYFYRSGTVPYRTLVGTVQTYNMLKMHVCLFELRSSKFEHHNNHLY